MMHRTPLLLLVHLSGCLLFESPIHEDGVLLDGGPAVPVESCEALILVAPDGDDRGAGDEGAPLASFAEAFARAMPGDCIVVRAGEYSQTLETSRSGESDRPVQVLGMRGARVVATDASPPVRVRHDFVELQDLEVEGFIGGDEADVDSYAERLIDVAGDGPDQPLRGVVLRGLRVRRALGHCIRLGYFVQSSTVVGSEVSRCGLLGSTLGGAEGGAAILLGTPIADRTLNPTPDVDRTTSVSILGNVLSGSAECIHVGEGATNSVIAGNTCAGAYGRAGLLIAGSEHHVQDNRILQNAKDGLILGGESESDGTPNGTGNVVRCNEIADNGTGLRFEVAPQTEVCGTRFMNNRGGDAVGPEAGAFSPEAACTPACP